MVLRKLKKGYAPEPPEWSGGLFTPKPSELDWRTGKRTKFIDEWRDSRALGNYLFKCIEELEILGLYATVGANPDTTTCMDYILKRATQKIKTNKNAPKKTKQAAKRDMEQVKVLVTPDSYNGLNYNMRNELQEPASLSNVSFNYHGNAEQVKKDRKDFGIEGESLDQFLYRYYGLEYTLLTAIAEFYFKNNYAYRSDEAQHCSVTVDDPELGWVQERVNCLTHFMELGKKNLVSNDYTGEYDHYIGSGTFIDIINSGTRCGKLSHTTYNDVDIYNTTSCLDLALDLEFARAKIYGNVGEFTRHIDRFNMSLDCLDLTSRDWEGTRFTCMERLIRPRSPDDVTNSPRFFHLVGASGAEYTKAVYNILKKSYDFKHIEDYEPQTSSALDYMINSGNYLHSILEYGGTREIMFDNDYCKSPNYTGADFDVQCISKLLVNLRNHKYGTVVTSSMEDLYHNTSRLAYLRALMETGSDCIDINGAIPCISYLIDIVSERTSLSSVFLSQFETILSNSPISAREDCIDTTIGNESHRTNCMDKIIGISTPTTIEALKNSGTLVDVDECYDWNRSRMNCVDKLFQRHEMWIYAMNRNIEYEKMDNPRDDYNTYNYAVSACGVKEDPGFGSIAGDYDIGAIKVHSPSKTFNLFQPVIRKQLQDYESLNGVAPTQFRINHAKRLLSSVSSDKPSGEMTIVPRIYDLADAYTSDYSRFSDRELLEKIGLNFLIQRDRPSTVSYNMFECVDEKNRRISCMQKHIDTVIKRCVRNDDRCKEAVESVSKMKDIFKDGMCVDYSSDSDFNVNAEKMPCVAYAIKYLNFDTTSYTGLISRNDFEKLKNYEIVSRDGSTKTLSEIICSHVSIEGIAAMINETHPISQLGAEVLNESRSHDGAALRLYSNCACAGIKNPMEKRICLDTACFREFVRGTASRDKQNWAAAFLGSENTPEAYAEAMRNKVKEDKYDWGNKIVRNLTPDKVRDNYYPYEFNGSRDYFGLAGVYDLEFDPADYHITNIERTDATGKVRKVFSMEETLNELHTATLRAVGMTIPMAIPQVNDIGEPVMVADGKQKEVKGKATIDSIHIIPPEASDSGEWEFTIDFWTVDDRFKSGRIYWTKEGYNAIEAFGSKGIFNRSDLKNVVIRYARERELVKQMSTRQKASSGTTALKLVVSNRPADYMRASTCQGWRSCQHTDLDGSQTRSSGFLSNALPIYMGTGGYIAYIAGDEFAPTWWVRAFLLPLMNHRRDDPKWDATIDINNNIRVPKIYGMTSHKKLLEDALMILIGEKGYNKENLNPLRPMDSSTRKAAWYNTVENHDRLKGNLEHGARVEAYRKCLDSPEFIEFPGGKTIKPPRPCSDYLHSDVIFAPNGSSEDILKVANKYGHLSDRTYNRVKAIETWRDYDDDYHFMGEAISKISMDRAKHSGRTRLTYEKPLTTPDNNYPLLAEA